MVLPLEVARAVVRDSGRQLRVNGRPWMQGKTSPIPGSMVWVRLPAEVQALLPALWKKLVTSDQLSPYFGGLVSRDQVGRVGFRILGKGPVSGRVLHLVGDAHWGSGGPQAGRCTGGGIPHRMGFTWGWVEGGPGGVARRLWGGGGRGGGGGCGLSSASTSPILAFRAPAGMSPWRGSPTTGRGF